jgi:AcrR family transcriptional regulator
MAVKNKATGRVEARRRERLEQITRTAVSLFYRNGYPQTSTREIAEACGISKGNLYHYIKTKEDLLSLSVEISSRQIAKFASNMLRGLKLYSPTEVLVKSVRETIQMVDDLQEMIPFWYRESGHVGPKGLEELIRQDMYTIDLYEKILEEGVKKGEFRISDPKLAAFEIMMLCDLWSLKRWYMRKHYTMDEYIKKCQEIALAIALGSERDKTPAKLAINATRPRKAGSKRRRPG